MKHWKLLSLFLLLLLLRLTWFMFKNLEPLMFEAFLPPYLSLGILRIIEGAIIIGIIPLLYFLLPKHLTKKPHLQRLFVSTTILYISMMSFFFIETFVTQEGALLKDTPQPLTPTIRQSDPSLSLAGWDLLRNYLTINSIDSTTIFLIPPHQKALATLSLKKPYRMVPLNKIYDSTFIASFQGETLLLITDNRFPTELQKALGSFHTDSTTTDTLDIVRNNRSEKQIYITHLYPNSP